jgi:hypothetical protein
MDADKPELMAGNGLLLLKGLFDVVANNLDTILGAVELRTAT